MLDSYRITFGKYTTGLTTPNCTLQNNFPGADIVYSYELEAFGGACIEYFTFFGYVDRNVVWALQNSGHEEELDKGHRLSPGRELLLEGVTPLPIGTSAKLAIGDWGNPLGPPPALAVSQSTYDFRYVIAPGGTEC